MRSFLRFITRGIGSLLLPSECVGCGAYGSLLCDSCLEHIPVRNDFLCPGCWRASLTGEIHERCRSLTPLDGILITAPPHTRILERAIRALKYEGVTRLATPLAILGYRKMIASSFFFQEWIQNETILIPIPLHARKAYLRNFNQSTLMVRSIARLLPLTVRERVIEKHRSTKSQTSLTKQERMTHPSGSFRITHPTLISGKRFLVFDDIVTTGATMSEVARTLKAAGAEAVWGIALVHG